MWLSDSQCSRFLVTFYSGWHFVCLCVRVCVFVCMCLKAWQSVNASVWKQCQITPLLPPSLLALVCICSDTYPYLLCVYIYIYTKLLRQLFLWIEVYKVRICIKDVIIIFKTSFHSTAAVITFFKKMQINFCFCFFLWLQVCIYQELQNLCGFILWVHNL